jgi:hypothetical protein
MFLSNNKKAAKDGLQDGTNELESGTQREPKDRYLARLPQYEQLQAEMDVYYKSVYAIIGRDVPARLNRLLKFVSGEFLYNMRMMCLGHALEQGHIVLPVEPEKSTIAMLMMIGL